MSHTLKVSLVALSALTLALAAGSAQAGSQVLGNTGWTASWDSSLDSVLSLSVDQATGVITQKTATFNSVDPIPIVFQQTSANATGSLDFRIAREAITNKSGQDWGGYQMQVLSGANGSTALAAFNPEATQIGLPGGWTISPPFSSATFSTDNRVLDLNGAVIANGSSFTLGGGVDDTSALVISAAPTASGAPRAFVLKEIPVVTTVIPVPAAAWTGLSGLVGLGLFGAIRKVRSLIA